MIIQALENGIVATRQRVPAVVKGGAVYARRQKMARTIARHTENPDHSVRDNENNNKLLSHKIHLRASTAPIEHRSRPQATSLSLSLTHTHTHLPRSTYSLYIFIMKGLWIVSAFGLSLAAAAASSDRAAAAESTIQLRRSLVGRPVDAKTEVTRRLHVQSLRQPDGAQTVPVVVVPPQPLQRTRRLSSSRGPAQRRKLPGTLQCLPVGRVSACSVGRRRTSICSPQWCVKPYTDPTCCFFVS
jgi:hypothetical protein